VSPTSVREEVAPAGVGAFDLTPEMHSTLQALGDVETRYRAERDRLRQWPGSRALKSVCWRNWRLAICGSGSLWYSASRTFSRK
jgi:hypothetical protein